MGLWKKYLNWPFFLFAYFWPLHVSHFELMHVAKCVLSNQETACLPVCLPAALSPSRPPGAVFDRQASIRRSLINTDTVSRRPKKVKRRKTISGLPDNINLELGMVHRGPCVHVAPYCPQTCTNTLERAPLISPLPSFVSNLTKLKKMIMYIY